MNTLKQLGEYKPSKFFDYIWRFTMITEVLSGREDLQTSAVLNIFLK